MKYLYFLLTFFCINSVVAESQGYEHIRVSTDIELIRINGNFYVHTTWYNFPEFGRFPSNGLIFIKNGKALLIDTPNTYEQTLRLDNYLKDNLNAVTTKIIVGHSHTDCMGGLSVLHEKGVESVACSKTISICKSKKLPIPQKSFSDSMTFEFEGEKVICKYFGAGHTVDNIVVYFPDPQILFGGCLTFLLRWDLPLSDLLPDFWLLHQAINPNNRSRYLVISDIIFFRQNKQAVKA